MLGPVVQHCYPLCCRDTQGAPTGLLADNAMSLVVRHIPPTSLEERRAAFRAAAQHALSKGITMVRSKGTSWCPGAGACLQQSAGAA